MSSIDGISLLAGGLSLGRARRARGLQKANAASGLHAEVEEEPCPAKPVPRDEADLSLDHSGTGEAVPFRNVKPEPFFVAQLLGQIMPNPEQSKSSGALAAYKEIALRLRLYDRIL